MINPLVSIIIPVYNGANYLQEAINSALAQTYPYCEVIVINDGSTDGGATEAIALSYHKRIRYFSKDNGGVASALNLGIRHMQGIFFSWLSHDDIYLPDKCQGQMAFWQQSHEKRIILYAASDIIDAEGRKIGAWPVPDIKANEALCRIWGQSFLNGCTMLIPRFLLLEAGGFCEALPTTQDYDLWLRLTQYAVFRRYPGVVLLSRQHEAQGSKSYEHKKECSELFSRYVPQLLQQVRKQEGGVFKAAPLITQGIAQRIEDYGALCAYSLYTAFGKNTFFIEKCIIIIFLLRGLPRVCLRKIWLNLPEFLRQQIRIMIRNI